MEEDFSCQKDTQSQQPQEKPFDERLADYREDWTKIVIDLTHKMKEIHTLENMMNEVYIRRQECVEHIAKIQTVLAIISNKYNKEKVARFNNYKMNSQLRYTSDSAINTQVDVDLGDMVFNINILKSHLKAMDETLVTINDIIYGIHDRIQLYSIINGLKF